MPKFRSSIAAPRRATPRRETLPDATSQPTDGEPAWFTISQLSRRWQLDRKTIYKFIECKVLPVWKVGTHLYRVSADDILRFEARNKLPHD